MEKKWLSEPLLLIDCGNTRLKWAFVRQPCTSISRKTTFDQTGWIAHQHPQASIQLALTWQALDITTSVHVWFSNVAGTVAQQMMIDALHQAFGTSLYLHAFKSTAQIAGIQNLYQDPAQLGSDRYAAMIGARALFIDQALIVINCGTALTIDSITADGKFLGGLIAPGLHLMTASLNQNTAQLPDGLALKHIPQLIGFPRNSADAILSGCLAAQVGAIEFASHHFKNYLQQQNQSTMLLRVISGGDAPILHEALSGADLMVDNLVLLGLYSVALYTRDIGL